MMHQTTLDVFFHPTEEKNIIREYEQQLFCLMHLGECCFFVFVIDGVNRAARIIIILEEEKTAVAAPLSSFKMQVY